jgi:hypothetical protein
MLLHAAIDWNSGEMGFQFLGDSRGATTPQ